jgi:DNA-binding response OmpR family regulator
VKALVVDDDRVLADLVAFTLRKAGFQVVQAFDGPSALARWVSEKPDIVILDVNLPPSVPPLSGFTICARIRHEGDTPVILLTVRDDEEDIVHGLQMGADDYILKPFSPRQLVARVQAVLRRTGISASPAVYQWRGLVFDPGKRELRPESGPVLILTPLENRLLECLSQRAGHYVPVDEVISHVWGPEHASRDMLRQLVHRLRSKVEVGSPPPVEISNLPGLGYGLLYVGNEPG